MLRNYLAAALRNIVRNKLTASVAIGGLGIAFGAAFLIALFVHDEFSYENWIPGHERIVRIRSNATFPHTVDHLELAPPSLAAALRNDVLAAEAVTRVAGSSVTVGQGDIERQQKIYWADANLFDVFAIPFVAGDRAHALTKPESVVLSRTAAHQFFGSENVIGRTLTFNRTSPMSVTGVMEDLPSNTHLDLAIVASGVSSRSNLMQFDSKPTPPNSLPPMVYVYARLGGDASLAKFEEALTSISARSPEFRHGGASISLEAEPISEIHLRSAFLFGMKESGSRKTAYAFLIIGGLIVTLSMINFVGISTATARKRSVEIGIRKVSGADRAHLFRQFTTENVAQVTVAMALGLAIAWIALPSFNALFERTIAFPFTLGWVLGIILTILVAAVIAGSYAAILLYGKRPARILRSDELHRPHRPMRGILITTQFAILIALGLIAGIVAAQLRYALTDGLRFEKEQVLQITTSCSSAFAQEARQLNGVVGAACANGEILVTTFPAPAIGPDGRDLTASISAVDFGYFELFGLEPVAGRFFSRAFGGDAARADQIASVQPAVVVNEALVRAIGITSAELAVGKTIRWARQLRAAQYNAADPLPSEIIGVVPDFARGSVRERTPPTIFWVDPAMHRILNLKLDGAHVPETLAAIDALWRKTGEPRAIIRGFVDQAAQTLYLDLTRQTQVLNCLAVVAVVIAALGLFGLATFTAEQRTKEIGVRKAMGANRRDILCLVLWQFTKPVLLANAIAWPIAYFAMRRWLEGFAYHIDLSPWMFALASALAVAIALATVIGHALLVARAHPVTALRYE